MDLIFELLFILSRPTQTMAVYHCCAIINAMSMMTVTLSRLLSTPLHDIVCVCV